MTKQYEINAQPYKISVLKDIHKNDNDPLLQNSQYIQIQPFYQIISSPIHNINDCYPNLNDFEQQYQYSMKILQNSFIENQFKCIQYPIHPIYLPVNNEKLNETCTNEEKYLTRKKIYGKGSEFERLKKQPHFQQPYQHLEIYNILGKPDKSTITELGIKYNEHFKKEIRENKYPIFGRNEKRNKTLAIWFFEDIKHIVIPWLREIGKIL